MGNRGFSENYEFSDRLSNPFKPRVDSILASHPAAPGSILGVPKIFSDLDVVEIYQQRALLRQWTVQRA